jgi:hypothetical protein
MCVNIILIFKLKIKKNITIIIYRYRFIYFFFCKGQSSKKLTAALKLNIHQIYIFSEEEKKNSDYDCLPNVICIQCSGQAITDGQSVNLLFVGYPYLAGLMEIKIPKDIFGSNSL